MPRIQCVRHGPCAGPETFSMTRFPAVPRIARALVPPVALVALAAALGLAGCANDDVARLQQENRVQDQRLRALEEGMSDALRAQFEKMNSELQDLRRIVEGRTQNIDERLDQ